MSISSVTPTLNGAPETLIRRAGPEARVGRLPVHEDQLVNPRLAVDGRPQTVQDSEATERSAVRRRAEEEEDAFPDQEEEEDDSSGQEQGRPDDEEQELLAAAGEVAKMERVRQAAHEIPAARHNPGTELPIDSDEKLTERGRAGDAYEESARPEGDGDPKLFDFIV